MSTPEEARRRRERVRHVRRTYGITEEMLVALEAFQAAALGGAPATGGTATSRCWGCGRATGASKSLAVDHNHRTGEVRMLLCATCNRIVVGRAMRDNPVALLRLGLALVYPPSRDAWAGAFQPGWRSEDDDLGEWLDEWSCAKEV